MRERPEVAHGEEEPRQAATTCHDVLINLDDAETMRCRSGAMRCGAVRCGAAADDERSNDVESSNVPSARGEHFIYKDLQQGP